MKRLCILLCLICKCAFGQLNFNDAGLVWAGLYPGYSATNAIHNIVNTGIVGNTRGAGTSINGGILTNSLSLGTWVGLGTNITPHYGATELTLSCWVRMSVTAVMPLLNDVPSTGTNQGPMQLSIITANRISGYIQTHASTNYIGFDKSGLPALTNRIWNHVAMTWIGGGRTNLQLYINGNSMTVTVIRSGAGANITNITPSFTRNEVRIGAFSNGANTLGNVSGGAIRMARMYTRAFTTNEIKALYISELPFAQQ